LPLFPAARFAGVTTLSFLAEGALATSQKLYSVPALMTGGLHAFDYPELTRL